MVEQKAYEKWIKSKTDKENVGVTDLLKKRLETEYLPARVLRVVPGPYKAEL